MSRTIWIIAEQQDGELHRGATELAAAGRGLDAHLVGVVLAAEGTAVAGQVAPWVDEVLLIEDGRLEGYSLDAWAQAITAVARERQPDAILLPHAPLGRDLGPVLAARLETGMLSDCLELDWEDGLVGTRSVYRRKLVSRERVVGRPAIATCQRGAFVAGDPGSPAEIERVAVDIDPEGIRSELISLDRSTAGGGDLTAADIVVAGGRGFGDAERFEVVQELADALGGAMGASRPVTDQGWVPHELQIGSSGVTVRPKLYLALAISGAIQHIVGMRESDVIVAVNKDPHAPIFEYAHYGIVGDVFEVVPALIEKLRDG